MDTTASNERIKIPLKRFQWTKLFAVPIKVAGVTIGAFSTQVHTNQLYQPNNTNTFLLAHLCTVNKCVKYKDNT